MKKLVLLYASLCAMAFALAQTSAHAQAFVSVTGTDTGTCTQAAPCATFQYAFTQTSAGGFIECLNSGRYSTTTLTITHTVVIDCGTGNVGLMDLSGGGTVAINVNASVTSKITLRHLSIAGLGTSGTSSGVVTTDLPGGELALEHCTVHGFDGSGAMGISFTPTNGRATLFLVDTGLGHNNIGISVAPGSGQIASVFFDKMENHDNASDGLDLAGAGVVAGDMRESSVVGNTGNGIVASSAGGVYFTIEESTVVDNLGIGIETNSATADVSVAGSTIGGNGTGLKALSGQLVSFGDNHISANGSNGSFTSTTPLQ